jgi:hypothetical protein
LKVFFVLLGSARIKSACRTLMKLTPGFAKYCSRKTILCGENVHRSSCKSLYLMKFKFFGIFF